MIDPYANDPPADPPRATVALSVWDRLSGMWVARSWSVGRVGLIALTLAVVVATGSFLLRTPPAPIEAQVPMAPGAAGSPTGGRDKPASDDPGGAKAPPGSEASADDEAGGETLTVHAAGAVLRPGVYRMPSSARVVDLVDEAGGLAPDADPDRLNLAAVLTDGARIWVPRIGEEQPPEAVNGDDGGAVEPGADATGTPDASSPVNLNSATVAELDTLPGVGPATAEAIIEYRTTNGPFRSVDELIDVRGIGEAKLADLRDRVRV